MLFSWNTSIWLYPVPVDFRKQLNGLVQMIADHLALNPTSGQLFIFRNRQGTPLKCVWWDRTGFWLCCKRLERGRFLFPEIRDQVMELSRNQWMWLLSGLDCIKPIVLSDVKATNFF